MRRTYSAEVYRDNAEALFIVDSRTIGSEFATVDEARDAIRQAIAKDGWHYGSIHEGDLTPAVFGVRPASFESDDRVTPWQVGPDWFGRG